MLRTVRCKKTDALMEYLSSLDIPGAEDLDDDAVKGQVYIYREKESIDRDLHALFLLLDG